jgi:predicted transposase/invertase (TIGR01784 family)
MAAQNHVRFDWAIKRLLRQKSNFGILEGFLSELFNFDVLIQEILESESNKISNSDKFNRVDILAKDNHNQLILIEVQNERQHDYFHRMNYGQAKLISENISAGDTYDQIKKVYSVNIVYFELGQGKDYVYIGKNEFRGLHFQDILQLSEKQKQIYPAGEVADLFATYYILKVNNFDDKSNSKLDEWIYFLKNNEIPDNFAAKGIREAKEKLRIDNLQDSEKEDYENYIKDQRNKAGEIKTAFIDGQTQAKKELLPIIKEKEKTIEEKEKTIEANEKKIEEKEKTIEQERKQKEEAKQKLAVKMKKYGESVEEIIKETGLSRKEIEKL